VAKKKVVRKKKPSILKKVSAKSSFHLCDGTKINSLVNLALKIDQMSDETYYHHANETRNDFATWIHDVYKVKKLAHLLPSVRSKHDTQVLLLKFIVKSL